MLERHEQHPLDALSILVDLDGVVCDLHEPIRQSLRERLDGFDIDRAKQDKLAAGITPPYSLLDWPEIQSHPFGRKTVGEMFANPRLYSLAVVDPEAVRVINGWRGIHKPWIVTARPGPLLRSVTRQWLVENGLDWMVERTYFSDSPTSTLGNFNQVEIEKFKARVAARIDCQIVIEDNRATIAAINPSTLIIKLLLSHSYNQGPVGMRTVVVQRWSQIADMVEYTRGWKRYIENRD